MVKPVVEAKLVTFKLVVVERLAKRLVVEETVEKKREVVAKLPITFAALKFPTVDDPEAKRLPVFR